MYCQNDLNVPAGRMPQALGTRRFFVLVKNYMTLRANLNEFGRFAELSNTVDKEKAKEYFEKVEKTKILPFKVKMKADNLLRDFILKGGYEIPV